MMLMLLYRHGEDGDVISVGAETDLGYAVETRYNKRLFEDPDAGNKLADGYVMGFNITRAKSIIEQSAAIAA